MDPETRAIALIRDALISWKNHHKAHCDEATCMEPANALAYLAHCVGLRVDQVRAFTEELAKYENTCAGCQHLRN